MKPICPECNRPLYYEQRMYELHHISEVNDDGSVDLIGLIEDKCDMDDTFTPRLICLNEEGCTKSSAEGIAFYVDEDTAGVTLKEGKY